MPTHSSVPTTCTASHLINWSISNLKSSDPKLQVNTRLRVVNELISYGFKSDFAIIFAITTDNQIKNYGLDEFLPKIGFAPVFDGMKSNDKKVQRHQETGDLTMWCTTPANYEANLKAFKKELEELKDKIDPPKKPDPKRQAFPDIRIKTLADAGIIKANTHPTNVIKDVLVAKEDKALRHIKMKYGFDPTTMKVSSLDWTSITYQSLKNSQKSWKEELV